MFVRRLYLALLALAALLPLLATPAAAQSDQRCFQATGYCISGAIRGYWERNGGLAVFGYPITPQRVETVEGRTIPVQWFERDRLEIQNNGIVTAGRLGARYLELTGRPWRPGQPMPYNPDCVFFSQTGYNLCGTFRRFWENNGGLERFGYPISDPVQEYIEGRPYTVQYFERRRMEYHPENAGTAFEVLLGLLGRDVYNLGGATAGCNPAYFQIANLARRLESQIGCPTIAAREGIRMAEQAFEGGVMLWVANEDVSGGTIYVIFNDSSSPTGRAWRSFPDTYREGEPVNTDILPPPGKYVPVRGFGKLWRDNDWVRGVLGFASIPEYAERGAIQPFQNNVVVIYREMTDKALVLYPLRNAGAAGPASDIYPAD